MPWQGDSSLRTLEDAARLFRSIVDSARASRDTRLAARLEVLAREAEERLQRARARVPADEPRAVGRRTRVVLVDDHELAREALRSVLTPSHGFTVVGEAGDGETALRLVDQLRPELVVMDARMPGLDGLAATRALRAAHPDITVVILSSHEDRALVLESFRAGAAGYLLKGAGKVEVLEALHAAVAGEHRVQSSLAASLLGEEARGAPAAAPQSLSERELEVLRLLAQGFTNQAIGYRLDLSVNTVKTHVSHVLRKLDAPDRAAAAARAATLGYLQPPLT